MFQVLGGEHVANGSRIGQNSTEVQWSPYEIVKKNLPPQVLDRHYLVQVNSELAGLTGIASDDTDTTHSRWHQSIETQRKQKSPTQCPT